MLLIDFNLRPVDLAEIESKNLPKDRYWFVKHSLSSDEKEGPFFDEDLFKIIEGNNQLIEYVACKFDSQNWIPLLDIKTQVGQKPRLVSLSSAPKVENYFLLISGQKSGPFKEVEIKEKLKLKEIIVSDYVSEDNGLNWLKISELFPSEMNTVSEHLPNIPKEDTFNHSKLSGLDAIEQNFGFKESLAMFASSGRKKVESTSSTEEIETEEVPPSSYKKVVGITLSLCATIYFGYKTFSKPKNISAEMDAEIQNEMAETSNTSKESAKRFINSPIVSNNNIVNKLNRIPASDNLPPHMVNPPVPLHEANIEVYDEAPVEPDQNFAAAPPPPMPPEPVDAQAEPPTEIVDVQPEAEAERMPANDAAVPPAKTEEQIFNQEAEN